MKKYTTPALPKTRSGKIMRRILRKIAENAGEDGAVILDSVRRLQREKGNDRIGYDVIQSDFFDMVEAGIIEDSAYYESLHEVPLICNLIARKKLYEMNVVISDTAEYGCYLFDQTARPFSRRISCQTSKRTLLARACS